MEIEFDAMDAQVVGPKEIFGAVGECGMASPLEGWMAVGVGWLVGLG